MSMNQVKDLVKDLKELNTNPDNRQTILTNVVSGVVVIACGVTEVVLTHYIQKELNMSAEEKAERAEKKLQKKEAKEAKKAEKKAMKEAKKAEKKAAKEAKKNS